MQLLEQYRDLTDEEKAAVKAIIDGAKRSGGKKAGGGQ